MKTLNNRNSKLQNTTATFTKRSLSLASLCLLVALSLLTSLRSSAQCANAPSLVFNNPVLVSGVDKQVGAKYRFNTIAPGLDAEVTIVALNKGAQLNDMDNTTQGYGDAWQPYVTASANDSSSLDWKITFKKAGSAADTSLPCLAITAIDIDGDSYMLKEFIQASTPGSYSIDPASLLHVTFDGVRTTAIGPISTVPMIDTSHREVMFQMNFQNVNTILYRNGSISTKTTSDVRHTCIYFKPFFSTYTLLPVKLTSFTAKNKADKTQLTWDVEEENNMQGYTVQYSEDGKNFEDIATIAASNSTNRKRYNVEVEKETAQKVYYRLMQVERSGMKSYSKTIVLTSDNTMAIACNTVVTSTISLKINSDRQEQLRISIYNQNGQLVKIENKMTSKGQNNLTVPAPNGNSGLYLLAVRDTAGHLLHSDKIFVTGRN